MDLLGPTRREKHQTFFIALALALVVSIVAAPIVEAALTRVKLAGGRATAKIRDTDGSPIESRPVGPMGVTGAPGSDGALATRSFSGGGGLLGAGDCTASTEPAQGPLPNTVTISGSDIITGLIVTGTGTVRVTSSAIGSDQVPLANFVVNANAPNQYIEFGYGLTANSPFTFTGIDGTACNFLVVGQGQGDSP